MTSLSLSLPEVGERIGPYQVLSELGRGGMAAVYLVSYPSMARNSEQNVSISPLFAMKILLPHLRSEQRFVDLFVEEARVAASIEGAHFPRVFELGETDRGPYLVMQRVRGVPLSELAHSSQQAEWSWGEAAQVFMQIAEALSELHESDGARIIHRDLSPDNVMLTEGGHAFVLDLGVARAADRHTVTQTGEIRGKLHLLAPEQLTRADEISDKADVWALGVMMWEWFAEQTLFKDASEAATLWNVTSKTVEPLSNEALPGELRELVGACLLRDPTERPSAAGVARRLRALSSQEHRNSLTDKIEQRFREQWHAERRQERAQVERLREDPPRRREPLEGLSVRSPEPALAAQEAQTAAISGERRGRGAARWAFGLSATLVAATTAVFALRSNTAEDSPATGNETLPEAVSAAAETAAAQIETPQALRAAQEDPRPAELPAVRPQVPTASPARSGVKPRAPEKASKQRLPQPARPAPAPSNSAAGPPSKPSSSTLFPNPY